MSISRRSFSHLAFIAGLSCAAFPQKNAYAQNATAEAFEGSGNDVVVVPLGCFAASLIFSLSPLSLSSGDCGDQCYSNFSSTFSESRFYHGDDRVRYYLEMSLSEKHQGCSVTYVDIGCADRSSIEQFLDAGNSIAESGSSILFLSGSLVDLPDTIFRLGTLLSAPDWAVQASYFETIYSYANEKKEMLTAFPEKKVCILTNEMGTGLQSYSFLEKNVLSLINATCINDEIGDIASGEVDDGGLLHVESYCDVHSDATVFIDMLQSDYEDEASPAGHFWAVLTKVKQPIVSFAPRTGFSWVETPLASQSIGLLWLLVSLWGDECKGDYSFMVKAIQDFFRLFVHEPISDAEIDSAIKGRLCR